MCLTSFLYSFPGLWKRESENIVRIEIRKLSHQINLDHLSMCVYTLTSDTHDPPQLGIESTVQLTIDQLGPAFGVASLWVYTSKLRCQVFRTNGRKNNKSRAVCAYSDTPWDSPQSPCDNEHVGPLQCSLRSTLYNCPVSETNVNQYERLNKRRHDRWDATVCSSAPSPGPGGIFLTWILRFYCSILYSLKT